MASDGVSWDNMYTLGDSLTLGGMTAHGAGNILFTIDLNQLAANSADKVDIIYAETNTSGTGTKWGFRTSGTSGTSTHSLYGKWGDADWNRDTNGYYVTYSTLAALDTDGDGIIRLYTTIDGSGTHLYTTDGQNKALYSKTDLKTTGAPVASYTVNSGIVTSASFVTAKETTTLRNLTGSGELRLSDNATVSGGNANINVMLNGKSLTIDADTTLGNIGADNSSKGKGVTVKQGVTLKANINAGWNPGNITLEEGATFNAGSLHFATNETSNFEGAGSVITNALSTDNGGKIDIKNASFTVNGDVTLHTTKGATGDQLTVSGADTQFHVTGNVNVKAGNLAFSNGTTLIDGTTTAANGFSINGNAIVTFGGGLKGNKDLTITNSAKVTIEADSQVAMLDLANGDVSHGLLTVKKGANMNVTGQLWMNTTAGATLEAGSSLTGDDSKLTIAAGASSATIASAATRGVLLNSNIDNQKNYTITNADVTVNEGGEVMTANMVGGSVTVDSGTTTTIGTGLSATTKLTVKGGSTVKFSGDTSVTSMAGAGAMTLEHNLTVAGASSIGTLNATAGAINLIGSLTITNGGATTIKSLTLGAGATLTLGSAASHNHDLTTTTLTVDGNSTINANLVVNDNGVMDFSNHTQLTMGCTVTIGNQVTIMIDDSELTSIVNTGAVMTIINDVEGVDMDDLALTLGSGWKFVDAKGNSLDAYNLRLDVVDVSNGKVNIVVAPEPATATLSLLALAALASRRRRH